MFKMSVLRVITRIIPLNETEASAALTPINAITDVNEDEIQVFYITDPRTGVNYRIERVKEFQEIGPGETPESVNQAFAEKLESIPGFVQLHEGDAQVNPHDRCLQLSVPRVISVIDGNISSGENSDPLTVSFVGNTDTPFSDNNEDFDDAESSDELFMPKYPCNARNKYKQKYKWRNKKQASWSRKVSKSDWDEMNSSWEQLCETQNDSHQTSDAEDDQETDYEKASVEFPTEESLKIGECSKSDEIVNKNNSAEIVTVDNKTSDISCQDLLKLSEATDFTNEPETMDSIYDQQIDIFDNNCDKFSSSSSTELDQSSLASEDNINPDNNASENNIYPDNKVSEDNIYPDNKVSEDNIYPDNNASENEQSSSQQATDSNATENKGNVSVCAKYLVPLDHPLYDCLESLKKYFVSGECLICGFISADKEYNAVAHMESHISSNASYSCYKCGCCNEKFCSPRSLYMHALAREKSFEYKCDICSLKFKRQHYLMCHNAKKH